MEVLTASQLSTGNKDISALPSRQEAQLLQRDCAMLRVTE